MAQHKRKTPFGDQIKKDVDRRESLQQKTAPQREIPPAADQMETFSIRLPASWKTRLEAHFRQRKGLSLGAGIRLIVGEYIERERV